jgi:hypothetical protein
MESLQSTIGVIFMTKILALKLHWIECLDNYKCLDSYKGFNLLS